MTGNVIPLGMVTRLNLPAERVLEEAKGHCTEVAIIIGTDADGEMYFASSAADGGEVIWYLEKAKIALLDMGASE